MQAAPTLLQPPNTEIAQKGGVEISNFREIEQAVRKEFPKLTTDWSSINPSFIVTLDGAAGTGKTTLALALARLYEKPLIDSGSLFTLVAAQCLDNGIVTGNESGLHEIDAEAVLRVAKELRANRTLSFSIKEGFLGDLSFHVSYNGAEVTQRLSEFETKNTASKIKDIQSVRSELKELQLELAQSGAISTGRKQWTEVFPERGAAIGMKADVNARAERSVKGAQPSDVEFSARVRIKEQQLRERDQRDAASTILPPDERKDVLIIDTTQQSPLQCALHAVRFIEKRLGDYIPNPLVDASIPSYLRGYGNTLN